MANGGIRVIIDTQEISQEAEVTKLFRLKSFGVGWFCFKNKEIVAEDIPAYDPKGFEEEKTPSQRLRSVLYVYFKEVKKGKDSDFDGFYRNVFEQLIENYKAKLPPR